MGESSPIQFLSSWEGEGDGEERPLSWIGQMLRFYEEKNIYRTVVLVSNQMILNYLAGLLEQQEILVQKGLGEGGVQGFLYGLRRVLFLMAEDFLEQPEEMLPLMAEHNLLVMENLRRDQETKAVQYVRSAFQRGFVHRDRPYYIWINE